MLVSLSVAFAMAWCEPSPRPSEPEWFTRGISLIYGTLAYDGVRGWGWIVRVCLLGWAAPKDPSVFVTWRMDITEISSVVGQVKRRKTVRRIHFEWRFHSQVQTLGHGRLITHSFASGLAR